MSLSCLTSSRCEAIVSLAMAYDSWSDCHPSCALMPGHGCRLEDEDGVRWRGRADELDGPRVKAGESEVRVVLDVEGPCVGMKDAVLPSP